MQVTVGDVLFLGACAAIVIAVPIAVIGFFAQGEDAILEQLQRMEDSRHRNEMERQKANRWQGK